MILFDLYLCLCYNKIELYCVGEFAVQTHKQDENENKLNAKKKILTKELIGAILIVISIATLFILLTGNVIFGVVGRLIREFIFGITGSVLSYSILFAMVSIGILLIVGKIFQVQLRTVLLSFALFALIVAFCHALTMQALKVSMTASYAEFVTASYQAGQNALLNISAGGAFLSVLLYPFIRLFGYVGTYIFLAVAIVVVAYFISFEKVKKIFSFFAKEKIVNKNVLNQQEQNVTQEPNMPQMHVVQPDLQSTQEMTQVNRIGQAENVQAVEQKNNSINENGLPNIIGKQYANYHTVKTVTTSQKKEIHEPSKPSFMQNGIFDADSYFNKRHLQNNSVNNVSNDYNSSQTDNWYPYGEPPVRNIFENNAKVNQNYLDNEQILQQSPQPISYATIYAKENEQPKPSSIVKPMVTTGRVDVITQNRMHELQNAKVTVTPIQNRNFVWGAGRESIQPIDRPIPESTMDTQPIQSIRNLDSIIDIDSQERMENSTSFTRNLESTAEDSTFILDRENRTIEEQFPDCRQMPTNSIYSRTSEENLPIEPSRTRDIFRERKEDKTTIDNVVAEENPSSPEDSNTTPFVWGRQSIKKDLLDKENKTELEEQVEDISDALPNAIENDLGIDMSEEREIDFHSEESYENIFDEEFIIPVEQSSNAIEGLKAVEEKQEKNTIEPLEDKSKEQIYSSPKDYRGLTPNFLQKEVPEQPKVKKRIRRKYSYPPIDLFEDIEGKITVSEEEKEKNSNIIIATLKGFNISAEIVSITCGPAVTRYDIDIPGNIPTSKVFAYRNELAMRLQSSAGVNIQNNYSNGSISIEVPNKERSTVGLKEILNDKNYKESCKKAGSLVFSLGKDIEGKVVYGDITKMKHLLVAGATGTGKSVFLNSLIISLIAKYSPEDLRIILIDPKQVEFSIYSKLPHLMVDEIICEASKVINVLNWSIAEMERRYGLFKEKGKTVHVRDIDEYNTHLTEDEEKLPKIVLIIDEVADLMQHAKRDIEDRIQSLTQKSRAAGIHLVLATQRPSVNVITGVIKANLPSRVAFKVAQDVDSRTILDSQGAENLLGKGDMLYKLEDMTMPARVQASYLSSEEVQKVIEYTKGNNESYFDESIIEFLKNSNQCENEVGEDGDNIQAVYIEALDIAITSGQVSISMIQRKLSVGYNKAGRIIEWMEHMGYISAFDGAKARRILITREEFEAKYSDYND